MTAGRAPLAGIVLAGGRARRFGSDKVVATVGGATLLERAVAACRRAGADPVVVVGPGAAAPPGVIVTREDPPFGGPVAALAAGLARVGAAERVLVVAADMPFAVDAVEELVRAAQGSGQGAGRGSGHQADGAWATDAEGREQPLLAVYDAAALGAALGRLRDVDGAAMRTVTSGLAMVEVAAGPAAADVDTPAQLAAARGGSA